MAAMRIARTVTGRDKIVMFTGSYHGIFDEVLVKRRAGQRQRRTAADRARHSAPTSVENMVVLDYGDAESLECIRERRRASSRPCWSSRCRAATRTCSRASSCRSCGGSRDEPGIAL